MSDQRPFLECPCNTPEYQIAHACCPKCGTSKFYSATMAFWGDQDRNKVRCEKCEWEGIRHDMVPLEPR